MEMAALTPNIAVYESRRYRRVDAGGGNGRAEPTAPYADLISKPVGINQDRCGFATNCLRSACQRIKSGVKLSLVKCVECEWLTSECERLDRVRSAAIEILDAKIDSIVVSEYRRLRRTLDDATMDAQVARMELKFHRRSHSTEAKAAASGGHIQPSRPDFDNRDDSLRGDLHGSLPPGF